MRAAGLVADLVARGGLRLDAARFPESGPLLEFMAQAGADFLRRPAGLSVGFLPSLAAFAGTGRVEHRPRPRQSATPARGRLRQRAVALSTGRTAHKERI